MPLAAGTRLGPYEILSPIGAGGMGEVYRARDTKLDRDVAIKVLPDAFASNAERLTRFEREAKLLASLNHPSIASIHGFEESDGVHALVLDLVEGRTLAERTAEGPIPVEDAIAIAKQMAEALEAGHGAGVIHRDLKLANVKLKADGTVKVLDYGLAKAPRATLGGSDLRVVAFADADSSGNPSRGPSRHRGLHEVLSISLTAGPTPSCWPSPRKTNMQDFIPEMKLTRSLRHRPRRSTARLE